jgi:TolB-like protein/Flp pilus assembly protein TadD
VTAPVEPLSRAKAPYLRIVAPLLMLIAIVAFLVSVVPRKSSTIRSLAVLPFANSSPNKANDYLSDGITENMINQLSHLPDLKVMARSTVFTYKGKETDPRAVGRELKVDAILTGRLLQQGDDLNIQVSLVRTSDGSNLWGEEYLGKVPEIFSVQKTILTEVSRKLRPNSFKNYQPRVAKDYTKNVQAYQLYLKGRYYLEKRTRDDFQRAVHSFQEAVASDPGYALAYSGLSDAFSLMCNWGFLPPKDGYPMAKDAVNKAIALDNSLAEAYTSLAGIESSYDWNWKAAEKNFQRAIQLNPNYAPAYHWYSFYLSKMGRHQEALNQIHIAQQLDPLSVIINANVGYTLYVARRYDEAIAELRRTVEFDRNFALAFQYLGYVYEQKGDYAQSVASLEEAVSLSPDNLTFDADLARAYAASGAVQQAQTKLDQLLVISTQTYIPAFDIANVYVGLKQYDRAVEYLERAYEEHADQLTYIGMEPRFDPLRKDPRFQEMLHRLGLH